MSAPIASPVFGEVVVLEAGFENGDVDIPVPRREESEREDESEVEFETAQTVAYGTSVVTLTGVKSVGAASPSPAAGIDVTVGSDGALAPCGTPAKRERAAVMKSSTVGRRRIETIGARDEPV